MALPPLVHYATAAEYRHHFEQVYCRGNLATVDGIRVYFSPTSFGHAFYESTNRDGHKNQFSLVRAQRINWIQATLEHPRADMFEGWDSRNRCYEATRRVAVVYEDFVVVVAIRLGRSGELKSNFLTCYKADNSIEKIRRSPRWTREACWKALASDR